MFRIQENHSTIGREVLGGITTFMAMSYILFVQPAMLSQAGMPADAIFMATCLSSALACIVMGLLANYPIALAPGMGENVFFTFTLCLAGGFHWSEALAMVAISGVLFLFLSLLRFRGQLLNAIPSSLKSGIAAGIGLFIALIGCQWGNLVSGNPNTLVHVSPMAGNVVAGLTLLGLGLTVTMMLWRVPGAILLGIVLTTFAAWGCRQAGWLSMAGTTELVAVPHGLSATVGAAWGGLESLWQKLPTHWMHILPFIFILLFMDMFDTVGTLVGVASRSGLMVDGKLPRANRALAADAIGTTAGAFLGSSTVTSYIESTTGVTAGARTGLAALVSGTCLLLALFFQPVVGLVGRGVQFDVNAVEQTFHPMVAPALILVGATMIRSLTDVQWDDLTEALPAFLAMVAMPFGYSISAGIAIGFISYAFCKTVTGRVKECPLTVYVFAVLFVVRYLIAT